MTMSTAAPGPLETVRAFVNTRDIEEDTDALTTPAALTEWLRTAKLLTSGDASSADVRRTAEFREALRDALAANHERASIPEPALAALNRVAERSRLTLAVTPSAGWVAQPVADGIDGALGRLLAIATASMADDTWRRLKVCANDTCRWAFYDASRARSGKWCSMQLCGNRAKQQAWRDRHDPQ
jgi:predicted RNA-binding Zn ribbon-like protein